MSNDTADSIIAEVFRLTGLRITKDDPVMAVLLMQEQIFNSVFSQFADHQTKMRDAFYERISTHEQNITDAAAKLEKYRELLLLELAQHADSQIKEAEGRIYASVSARIVKDVEAANAAFLGRLKKLLSITLAAVVVLMILLAWFIGTA